MRQLEVRRLGEVTFQDALSLQENLVEQRRHEQIVDQLLLLRHPHIITLGRSGSRQYLRHSETELAELGYPVVEAGRGGEVTYHGPGQLIAYPILKLEGSERDLHLYLRNLEEVAIRVCSDFGLTAERVEGKTGAWIENRKISAIGVRARSWVTFHGLSFNRTNDLRGFDLIVPCGLKDSAVTSLETELGEAPKEAELQSTFEKNFFEVFSRRL